MSEDLTSYICPVCNFSLWIPITSLQVSTLGLYSDRRFPGRCILALHDHYDDFAQLPSDITTLFVQDLQLAGRTIQSAVGADRINYAVLGNAVPHVHFHLIPRKRAGDPKPDKAPWESPLEKGPMLNEDVTHIRKAIAELIQSASNQEFRSI